VIYEQADDGGWGVYFPDVPGCTSWGATLPEAEVMAREVLPLFFEELRRTGQPIPQAVSHAGTVAVPAVATR
jgi:predicted RNase H-like HicB family nuclease